MIKLGIKWLKKQGSGSSGNIDKYYSEIQEQSVINNFKQAKSEGLRFITATCYKNDSDIFIFYHFEAKNALYTLKIKVNNSEAFSIESIYPTAGWIEREMTDLYRIKFKDLKGKNKKNKPLLISSGGRD